MGLRYKNDEYSCDYSVGIYKVQTLVGMKSTHIRCGRKPFAEVYSGRGSWSYLCFRHFLLEKLRGRKWAWCRASEDE